MTTATTLKKYMTVDNYRLVESPWGKREILPVPGVYILAKDRNLAVLLAGMSGDFMDMKEMNLFDLIPALEQGFLGGVNKLN